MSQATCKTCGASGPPWHHVPSMFDPDGIGDPGHAMPKSDNQEREKLENDLLEVVNQLPFMERGHTLAPDMYPELVDFILQDRQQTRAALVEEVLRKAPDNRAVLKNMSESAQDYSLGFNAASGQWRSILLKAKEEKL